MSYEMVGPYSVDYNNGVYYDDCADTLFDALVIADSGAGYTRSTITIIDGNGMTVARRGWSSSPYGMYSVDYDTCSFVDTADGSDWEYYPWDVYFREDDIIDFGNLGFYLPWGLCTPYRIDDDNACICRRDDEYVYIHLNHIKVENW